MKKVVIRLMSSLIIGVMVLTGCNAETSNTDISNTETSNTSQPASASPAASVYPTKPVKIIIGRSAGGSTDIVARSIQPYVSKYLGQNIVIENIPDAGGKIAFRQVFQSEPDGYTLLFCGPPSDILAEVVEEVTDYSFREFVPIYNVGGGDAVVFITSPNTGINTLDELIEKAKSEPITIAKTTGVNVGDLSLSMFIKATGIPAENLIMVPYGGASEIITAVMGNHTTIGMPQPVAVAELVNKGELNALVTFSQRPSPSLPDVITFDSVYPGNSYSQLTALFAPPGTSPEVQAVLEDAFRKAIADSEFIATYKDTITLEEMDSKELAKAVDDLYNLANMSKEAINEFVLQQ